MSSSGRFPWNYLCDCFSYGVCIFSWLFPRFPSSHMNLWNDWNSSSTCEIVLPFSAAASRLKRLLQMFAFVWTKNWEISERFIQTFIWIWAVSDLFVLFRIISLYSRRFCLIVLISDVKFKLFHNISHTFTRNKLKKQQQRNQRKPFAPTSFVAQRWIFMHTFQRLKISPTVTGFPLVLENLGNVLLIF